MLASHFGQSLTMKMDFENQILKQWLCWSDINVTGEYLRGESSERAPEYSWEDPEIMAAIRASFPDQLRQLNDTLKDCSAEEQQAVFTILVQLRSVLNLKDAAKRQTAISMIRNVAVDVEHLTSDGTAKEG